MIKAREAILKNVSGSITLTAGEEQFFLSLLKPRKFDKKDIVLNIRDTCRYQSFVVSGCLKVFYLDERGVEHIVKFALGNWWAFDIESCFYDTPSFHGIACLEDTEVLQLSREDHAHLVVQVPAFEKFYRLMMQNSFIALQHRVRQSLALTANERYIQFQQKYPGLEARVSQKDIASYLGITPVFLSMLRRQDLVKH